MTDLLTTLTQRTLGTVPVAEPIISSRFSPLPELEIPDDASAALGAARTPMVDDRSDGSTNTQQPPAIGHDMLNTALPHTDSALDLASPPMAPRRNEAPEAETVGDGPLLLPSDEAPVTDEVPPLPNNSMSPPSERPSSAISRRDEESKDDVRSHDVLLLPSNEAPPAAAVPMHMDDSATPPRPDALDLDPTSDEMKPLLPQIVRQPTPPLEPQHRTTFPLDVDREPADERSLPASKIEMRRTDQSGTPERQPTPKRNRKHLLVEPLDKTDELSLIEKETVPTRQAVDEAQSLTENTLLVPPQLTSHGDEQTDAAQHQIGPDLMNALIADDAVSPRLTEDRRETEPAPTPTVQVSIGRIEVRAKAPPPSVPQAMPARPQPSLSLDDYLKRRNGGQR